MKSKAKVMYTMAISIFLLLTNCSPTKNQDPIWIEVNRISEMPPKKGEVIKVGLYLTEDEIEIHKYMVDSILIGKATRKKSLEKIKSDLKINSKKNVSNTFVFENGALQSSGFVSIKSIVDYVDNNLKVLVQDKTSYERLYSDKYTDAQLGYLEYFINSKEFTQIDNVDNWNAVDEMESNVLADSIYNKTYTLARNDQNKFVLIYKDSYSNEFSFHLE